jgi:hypothetical protein
MLRRSLMRIPKLLFWDFEREAGLRRWAKSQVWYVPTVTYNADRLSEAGYKPPEEWVEDGWPEG